MSTIKRREKTRSGCVDSGNKTAGVSGGKDKQLIDDQDGDRGDEGGIKQYRTSEVSTNEVVGKCPVCKLPVLEDHLALECNLCELWNHIACSDISEAVYDFLTNNQESSIHWYCPTCNLVVGKMVKQVTTLSKRQDIIEDRMDDLESKTEVRYNEVQDEIQEMKGNIKTEINKQVLEQLGAIGKEKDKLYDEITKEIEGEVIEKFSGEKEKWQAEMREKVSADVKGDLAESYRDVLRREAEKVTTRTHGEGAQGVSAGATGGSMNLLEQTTKKVQNRMDRKNNIMVFGLPEEMKENMNLAIRMEKIEHDKIVFIELCDEMGITCYGSDIEEIRRVGRYQGNTSSEAGSRNPRPILVTLRSSLKDRIMRNLYKLKEARTEVFRTVGVSHDMTKEERQKDKGLREEAERKNKDDTSGNFYVVRGNPWSRYILKVKRWETTSQVTKPGTATRD